jgi:type IV pilus assembly protein PilW
VIMTTQPRFSPALRQSQKGLSLVELMVSLTIGLFLLGVVGIIYVNTVTSSRSSTLESQMNEDAALALELLQQQIRLAGFSNVNAAGDRLFAGQAVRGCDGGFSNNAGGAAFAALTCNAAGVGPDAVAVRYEASLLNSQTTRNAAGADRPGNCVHESLEPWGALTALEGAIIDNISLADNRYYIANDPNNDNTPTLYCQGRTGAGFGMATALIPNIEDMQVQYALTALPTVGAAIPHQVAGYANATVATTATDSAPAFPALTGIALPAGTPAGVNNWARVAALRVCLVARSARPVPTGDNPVGTANPDGTTLAAGLGSYIDCNGVSRTATDRYIRRAYVTTIQLRNTRPGLPSDFDGDNPYRHLYDN